MAASLLRRISTARRLRLATITTNPRLSLAKAGATTTSSSSFHSSASRSALKEPDRNREDLDETYEQNKQEQLRKQKEGTATWAESLASASEATVKAERGETPDPEQARKVDEEVKREKDKFGGKSKSNKPGSGTAGANAADR